MGTALSARRARGARDRGEVGDPPSQIDLANEMFSPPPAEVERAGRILAALDEAAREGRGAAQLDGKMIDAASARMAENVVRDGRRQIASRSRSRELSEGPATRDRTRPEFPWISTSTRPRSCWPASASRSRGGRGVQPRAGGVPRVGDRWRPLGREGADPLRRARARRAGSSSAPTRTRCARRPRRCSGSGW